MFIMWFSHYLLLCLKMWRNNKNMIVDKIVDQFLFLINNCDLNSVRALWSHFDLKIFSKLDYEFTSGLRKLESSLYKYYLVNAVSSKNPDKVNEFFAKMTHELQGQPEWKDWFMLPFIEKPEEHPTFNVHFTKQWQDTFLVSLHNFLSIIYQVMPQPALSSYEEEATKLRRLQEENDALKHKLATLSQCANVVPEAAPPMDIMDDFYIIAQESPTSHNENHPKTFKNLIRTIGGGLPTSPIMGRKPQPDEQFGVQKHHSSKRHTSQGGWIKQTSTTSVPKRSLSLDSRSRRRDASVESLDKRGNKKDNFLLLGQEKMCEHKSAVTQCKFNATGSTIASCDSDGVIKIWSAEPQIKVHSTMEFKSGFTSLSWLTKNERFFVTGSRDGIVRLHDSKESKTLWEIGKEENSILANTKILSLCCSPTECSVACSAVNINERTARLLLYDIKTKKIEQSFSLGSNSSGLTANCCQFNHNGSLLIVGCSDGSIRTLDLRNGECVESWGAHEGCVCAIQITSDHNSCYTLGADHKLCKYDLAHSGEPTLRVSLSNCQLSHGTQGFTLHQSGKLVLTACGNLGANIYQVTEGCVQSMLSLGGHRSPLTTCDWSTANQCSTCLSSSADGKIKISTILTP